MAKIRGIGGVFFKSENAEALRAWYAKHLGIESGPEGKMFAWRDKDDPSRENITVWSIFPASSNYFHPSTSPLMMNYIVDDLKAMLAELRANGVTVADKVEEHEYGKFGWVFDPDGNKIELWEPPPAD
jgi:catechol 2,3-dioxygenase-like lactoylglutathione lyase family enzyme